MTASARLQFWSGILTCLLASVLGPYFLMAGITSDRARASWALLSVVAATVYGIWMHRRQVEQLAVAAAPARELSLTSERLPRAVWLALGPPLAVAMLVWWVVSSGSTFPGRPRVEGRLSSEQWFVFMLIFWNGFAAQAVGYGLGAWYGMSRAYAVRRTLLRTALANQWLCLVVTMAWGLDLVIAVPADLEFLSVVAGGGAAAVLAWNVWRVNRLYYEQPRPGGWVYVDAQDPTFIGPRGMNIANGWFWMMQAALVVQVLVIKWILPHVPT